MNDSRQWLQQCWFASRLAWRQLTFGKAKLLAAVLGVVFAAVLVYFQTGFRDSLYASMALAPSKVAGDLFLVHRQSEAFWRTVSFPRSELMRAMAHPDVVEVVPLYMNLTPFRNPITRQQRTIFVFGYDPASNLMRLPEVIAMRDALKQPDTAVFDRTSRPEFGPLPSLLANGSVTTEMNGRKVSMIGLFTLGNTFSADGNIVMSDLNYFRLFPHLNPDRVDLGVIRIRPGADAVAVQRALAQNVTDNVYLFTYPEMVAHERNYWQEAVPIGFIFGFGMVMGLVVGMVIVYQILFTDITNHLSQYATLSAMGYSHGYLLQVVFASAIILAVLGFVPGTLLAWWVYDYSESKTYMSMPMPFSKIISIFGMMLTMCALSGALAIRKLRAVDPADMF